MEALLRRWDDQQAAYIAGREERFAIMLDVLELVFDGGPATVVDLACGPGSLTVRVLDRFPEARVVGVDRDPLLLRVAESNLRGRATLLDADLADAAWPAAVLDVLDGDRPQAMVSTTALHWLDPGDLVGAYTRAAELLAPGGVLLNGDHFRFDDRRPTLRRISDEHDRRTQRDAFAAGAQDWDAWWAGARTIDGGAELAAERERRFADRGPTPPTTVEFHLAALRQAGFAEAATVWQLLDDYVVFGRRTGSAAEITRPACRSTN